MTPSTVVLQIPPTPPSNTTTSPSSPSVSSSPVASTISSTGHMLSDSSSHIDTASSLCESSDSPSISSSFIRPIVPSQSAPSVPRWRIKVTGIPRSPRPSYSQDVFTSLKRKQTSRIPLSRTPKRPRLRAQPLATASRISRRRRIPTPATSGTVVPFNLAADESSMSLFTPQVDYLQAKLSIDYHNGGQVEMMGGPNTGTSYSLPGQVTLSLPVLPASLQGKVREIRKLELTVEGKSEFFDEEHRYAPLRLCRDSIDLTDSSQGLLIPSHDPNKPHASRINLAIPFDLRLPGWLPPSHISEMTNTSYGVIATALIGWPAPPLTGPSGNLRRLANNRSLCGQSTSTLSSPFERFSIRRHRLPSAVIGHSAERQERHFTLKPESNFPSPVECVVTVPDWVDVNGEERSLKVSLRMRAKRHPVPTSEVTPVDGDSAEGAPAENGASAGELSEPPQSSSPMERQAAAAGSGSEKPEAGGEAEAVDVILTNVVELGMEVEETERYTSTAAPGFFAAFPLPESQPSRDNVLHPLIQPDSHSSCSLSGEDDRPFRGVRTRSCLLADDGSQRNFWFAGDGLGLGDKWRKINIVLPMPAIDRADTAGGNNSRPNADMDGAFLKIKHNLKIRVVCRNANSDGTPLSMMLSTPIRFGTSLSTLPAWSRSSEASLPAYIQLFHENGDLRQCDRLPLYAAPQSAGPSTVSPHTSCPTLHVPTPSTRTVSCHKASSPVPPSPTPSYDSLFPEAYPFSSTSFDSTSYQSRSSMDNSSLGDVGPSRSASPSSSRSINGDAEVDHSSGRGTVDPAMLFKFTGTTHSHSQDLLRSLSARPFQ